MKGFSKVLVAVAVLSLLSLLIAAPSKPKAEECTITGDIISNSDTVELAQPVVIGVVAWTWMLTDPAGNDAQLYLSQNLLKNKNGADHLPAGLYYGKARVLKKQGRFDFDFGPDPCEATGWEDRPPFGGDDGLCPYRLIILDGLYDRESDDVQFEPPAQALLYDYRVVSDNYLVGGGDVNGILIDFPADSSGGKPGKGPKTP